MVNADPPQLRRTLQEELFLPFLASVGFEDHEVETLFFRRGDDPFDQVPGDWLEQLWIRYAGSGSEARILCDHVGIKSSHDSPRVE
jgi:hypothetical protein